MINYLKHGLYMIAVTVFYGHHKSQLIWARQDKDSISKRCTEKNEEKDNTTYEDKVKSHLDNS